MQAELPARRPPNPLLPVMVPCCQPGAVSGIRPDAGPPSINDMVAPDVGSLGGIPIMRQGALLGVGTMGSGMAETWLKKGFGLTVYNRTRSKAEALAASGAPVAKTPREAAAGAELVV